MKRPAILVVDDDDVSLRASERIAWLLQFAPVATLDSGLALDRVRRGERFAAVVARLEMKTLGGRELVARMARAGVALPALFLTDRVSPLVDLSSNQRVLARPFSLPIWPRKWQHAPDSDRSRAGSPPR